MLEPDTHTDTRKRDLVMWVSAILGLFSILGLILRLVTGMYQSNVAVLLVLSAGVCSWSFVSVRMGYSTTQSASVLLGFWSVILLLSGDSSASSISPTVMLLTVIPLLATMMINRSAGLISLALILLSLPVLIGDNVVSFEFPLGPATPENLMLLRALDLGVNTALVGAAIWRYAAIPTVMPDLIGQNVTHDFLTGLGNRRAVDQMLAVTTANACKNSEWLSIVLADMDMFRQFNKQFGSNSGDRCLVQVASILGAHIGQQDHYLGRYGGEKFAIILPNSNPRQAVISAEKLRSAVAEADIVLENSSLQKVTLTFGVASIRTDRDMDPAELIELAQQRLLSAKKAGRNQVQSVQISDSQPPVASISPHRKLEDGAMPLVAAR